MSLTKNIKNFLKKAKKPLIVILGPTASGKTVLSLKLAKDLKGEVISTDSRQIYKEMEIGTETITPEKQQGIPHHLLGIATPDKILSLAEYNDLAQKTIKNIHKRKKVPILVGGTGLYISSLIEGYEVPKVPPNEKLRAKLKKEAGKKGNEYLHKKLAKLDPEAAKKIHPNNLPYVIRALEINMETKKNKIDKKKKKSPFESFLIGIKWPREKLYERINKRVDSQIKRGLINEVKSLLEKYSENLSSMSSLGVKEIIPHIKNNASLEECVEKLKKNTRRYAKRQMTWFRRYKNIFWLTPERLKEYVGNLAGKYKKSIKKVEKAPKTTIKVLERSIGKSKKSLKKTKAKTQKTGKKIIKKIQKTPRRARAISQKSVKKVVKKISTIKRKTLTKK